jgi:glutamate carboxypeptidase
MKAGLVQGFWAVRALRDVVGVDRPVVFLCNSDEEIGSPTSRPLIEQEAARAAAVFVLEPSYNGALKTARKGVGIFHAELVGKPSHAGLDPFTGVSAIEELAHLILDLHALSDRETGTTVNVGVISGGTRSNVVAANARAEVDLRVVTPVEAERMTQRILGWKPHHPEVEVRLSGGMNRPPMERTEKTAHLFHQAQELAYDLGLELEEALVGGGSDGNFCAVLGVPVLDGLGAVGGGAHARHEHVLVDAMPLRAALLTRLLETV